MSCFSERKKFDLSRINKTKNKLVNVKAKTTDDLSSAANLNRTFFLYTQSCLTWRKLNDQTFLKYFHSNVHYVRIAWHSWHSYCMNKIEWHKKKIGKKRWKFNQVQHLLFEITLQRRTELFKWLAIASEKLCTQQRSVAQKRRRHLAQLK